MRTLQRLGLCGATFFLAASLFSAGCGPGAQNKSVPAPAPPAPPPPPPPTASAPVPAAVVEWKPNPALLDQLDDYLTVGDYEIRLPKECEPQPVSTLPAEMAASTKVKRWAGPMRQDGSRFLLSMVAAKYPPDDRSSEYTAKHDLKSILTDFEALSGSSEWEQLPGAETAQINGLPFHKTNFQGTANGKKAKWVCYVTQNAGKLIALSVFDFELPNSRSFDVGTTAIFTFRKK
jgi:hypothetical protein